MSRGSLKSDPFAGNEDTSSISARSDTSVDSYVFDPSFGKYVLDECIDFQGCTLRKKGNHFCDFLFGFLHTKFLSKKGSTVKGKRLPLTGANTFFFD